MLRSDKLWYALIRIGDQLLPDLLRFLTIWSRFDEAMLRLKLRFDKLYYALMRLWRFKSGSDTIIKLCCALLRSVKLFYALENVEIADFMPLLTQSYK